MKKTLALFLSALAAASMTTAVSAFEENTDYLVHGEMNAPNYPASTAELPEVTTGQLLKGTVISSVNALEGTEDQPLSICDGDPTTSFWIKDGNWIGIKLDQAYQLTEVRAVPNPNLTGEEMGGFRLQGSNDGESWVNILSMGQVAHGNDYHVFTPQTVTDQRYIDAGYDKRKDESIHWQDNGGSYQYYRMIYNVIADVELYGNPAPATELSRDLVSVSDVPTYNYYHDNYSIRSGDEVLNSVDGSLVGTIIGAGGLWNKAFYDRAFDNNNKTCYDSVGEGSRCWVGMMFDEPHALTEVRILPKRGGYVNIANGRFQGSLDGHNWRDLVVLSEEDVPKKQEWVIKSITDTQGYTHFRYVSSESTQSSIAELLLFGAPAEAAEPFTVKPLIATRYTFDGELYYAPVKSVVTDTEISGTPFCGKYFNGWISYGRAVEMAFDGDLETYYGTISGLNGSEYWVGLKADEATAVELVKFYNPRGDSWKTLYFQGSVDGINWVDLTTLNPATETVDADGWITKTISDTTVYSYFRLMNDAYDHPACSLEVNEIKIYAVGTAPETAAPETEAPETAAPETAAPETAAPETAAPETAAPETAAPETAAPETAAPETAAPETAAPETNAPAETPAPAEDGGNTGLIIGIVAVAVVVVGIVVAVIVKKKK